MRRTRADAKADDVVVPLTNDEYQGLPPPAPETVRDPFALTGAFDEEAILDLEDDCDDEFSEGGDDDNGSIDEAAEAEQIFGTGSSSSSSSRGGVTSVAGSTGGVTSEVLEFTIDA